MVLFERGKAEIRDEAKPTMKIVANLLRKRVRSDIKVVGHTSSLPLGPEAKASDHLTLGFLRAKAVSKHLAIDEGLGIKRFTMASQGNQAPDPSRENLWNEVEKDDRVEIKFLPSSDR